MATRSETEVFLIGHPPENFGGTKLPSNCKVLDVFFRLHNKEKKTICEAMRHPLRLFVKLKPSGWENSNPS